MVDAGREGRLSKQAMSKFKIILTFAFAALVACEAGPIRGSKDSGTNRLTVGMSPAQVARAIGAPQRQQGVPSQPGQICYSYIYDETIRVKYVHVVFENGILISASDRHRQPCNPT
jgi:hypothetical protein